MDGKSRKRHVTLRQHSILITVEPRHGDGTGTERCLTATETEQKG